MLNLDLVSFGTTVLDDIHFPSREPLQNVLGGSGVYCMLGARLFRPCPTSNQLGFVCYCGEDFPRQALDTLRTWWIRLDYEPIGKETTRGQIVYHDDSMDTREFRYLTPPLIPTVAHVAPIFSNLKWARIYHLLSDPSLARKQIDSSIAGYSPESINKGGYRSFIWEPIPSCCSAEKFEDCMQIAKDIIVFSPNHIELGNLFGRDLGKVDQSTANAKATIRNEVEELSNRCVSHGIGPNGQGAIVVRAGQYGCYVSSRSATPKWLPPYYEPNASDASKVVDPTGAGNAFLGGLAMGLVDTEEDFVKAAEYGAVSASFALEQIGLPRLDYAEGRAETWNGDDVKARLARYRERLAKEELE